MSAITIRKLDQAIHDALRRIAKRDGKSVEAVAREALEEKAREAAPEGVDFDTVWAFRDKQGLAELGEDWIDEFNDPAWGRKLFGKGA